MRNLDKGVVKKLSIVSAITIVVMVVLSVPLGSIPALGGLLFPGDGIWRVPGEVPVQENLVIPSLSDEVYVIRDQWGIPHIYATNESDLMFTQGYVHAQDRLFQMDMLRRQVRGKLSEVVGSRALPLDKLYLAMGCEYWANETYKQLKAWQADGTIDFLDNFERYADGINYYINTHKYEKPIEYHFIGFEPTEWTLIDTLCYAKEMAKQMTWHYGDLVRLVNSEALKAVSPTYYNELFRTDQPYQIPICPDYGAFSDISIESLPTGVIAPGPASFQGETNPKVKNAILNLLEGLKTMESERIVLESNDIIGSNNWVVDGAISSTGKPILANDMHLGWNVPGVWYQNHLVLNSPDESFNLYGFAIAGMPLIAVGHNQYVAWGFTNTGYDVLDWYYYDEVDDNRYVHNGVEKEYTKKTYTINIKDGAPVEFVVKETVHGPVLNDFIGVDVSDVLGDVAIAAQWTAMDITNEAMALNGWARSKNRDDFDTASQYWHTLAQNIIYADIDGNIAIRPTGRVPIRADGDGSLPNDGSKGKGEWTGFVPFNELPNSKNPDQHYLASANQIVAGPSYSRNYLQNEYADGYRARRINEVLSQASVVGISTMISLQNDVNSSCANAFTPYLLDAIANSDNPSKYSSINETMGKWTYNMDKDLAAPTIYRKWRDYFEDYTFNDEFTEYDGIQDVSLNTLEKLMKEEPNSHWFDDIDTATTTEDRDDIILKALDDTIDFCTEQYGSSTPSSWLWGDMHKVYFPSLIGLDALSKGPYRASGEGYTVNPSRVNIDNGPGEATGGASERIIVDFNDLNNSRSCIPSGQRAISSSEHYADQLEYLFLQGKYHAHWYTNTWKYFPEKAVESRINFTSGGV